MFCHYTTHLSKSDLPHEACVSRILDSLTRQLIQCIQLKMRAMGRDRRPMFGRVTNVIVVFGSNTVYLAYLFSN